MSEIMQQENVIDYIQLNNMIYRKRLRYILSENPDKDVLDFLECLICLILEDLEKDKGVWLEKWK